MKSSILALFLIAVGVFVYYQTPTLAGSSDNISGYAWSSNIGWVSLNSADEAGAINYGVTAGANGALSGYAWASNIGWVSFNANELNGCPVTAVNPTCAPKIDRASGAFSGWVRACAGTDAGDCVSSSRDDGWDGWISLKGENPSYGVLAGAGNPCVMSGWAWGGPVIGWINFDGARGTGVACAFVEQAAPLAVSCAANPNPALLRETVVWSPGVGGGTAPYSYSWSGTDGLSGNTESVTKSYTTFTPKQATVVVTDAQGASGSATCNLTITRLREVQP